MASFFVGQAMGFFFSGILSRRKEFALFWIAVPLPVLMSARLVVGRFQDSNWNLEFYLSAFFYLASLSAVYSSLLPSVIESEKNHTLRLERLPNVYTAELLGALGALLALALLGKYQWWALVSLYPITLILMVSRLGVTRWGLLALSFVTLLSSLLFYKFDRWSSERFYQSAGSYQERVEILYQGYSPYQKVEVLKVGENKILLLNGVEYFGDGTLDEFNYYLSELPASLYRPRHVLIIGSGSMSAVGRLAPYVDEVVTVELDSLVVEASLKHFSNLHARSDFQHTVVYDDGRRFLRSTDRKFDLIILDIPSAFTLQTGTLFTQDFFRLAKSRLTEQGVLSLYLTQMVGPQYEMGVAGPILAAVLEEFPNFLLVVAAEADNSFVYASESLPFSRTELDRVLAKSERFGLNLYETDLARREAAKFTPASLTNLRHVWEHQ